MGKRFSLFVFIIFTGFILPAQEINFSEHIAPIIFEKCTPCHQPNQIAPMPFTNYEEVSAYASMIKYVTEIKYMPPWKPVNSNHQYKGDRQLTDKEIEQIQKWVGGGLEEGDSKKLPPISFKSKNATIENPDAIVSMSASFEQYGVYYDQFRTFVLPTNFDQDKIINAIEFVPGNASIVRSCYISVDNSEKDKVLDDWDPQYGYFSFGEIGFVPDQSRWYTWYPLKGATKFPEGSGKYLPKNAKLLLHIHYGPTGTPQKDSSFIKLKFSDQPVTKIHYNIPLIHPYTLTNPPLKIPANQKIRFHAKFEVPFDMDLSGIMPHSHLLGRKWEIFAVEPKNINSQVLLKITDWDFKWKQQFDFDQPIHLQAGTIIHALAEYDNTLDNLFNPSDPPREMEQGRRMYEELFLVYFDFISPVEFTGTGIRILSSSTMVSSPEVTFQVQVEKPQVLNSVIKNFSNQTVVSVFQNKHFNKGVNTITANLKNIPKGNYYLELADKNGNIVGQSIFVFVEEAFFE
jgi:hypothetical protein